MGRYSNLSLTISCISAIISIGMHNMPRTSTGKPEKGALRDKAIAQLKLSSHSSDNSGQNNR